MKLKFEIIIILLFLSILSINTKSINNTSQKEQRYRNLINWAKQNKSSFNKFALKYLFGNNRFVVASETLKPGENISTISVDIILHDRHPEIKPTCDKFNIKDQQCVSTYICQEMNNPNNFFRAFLQFLPHDYNTFPIFYNSEMLSLIKGSQLHHNVDLFKKTTTTEYNKLKSKNVTFSYKEYVQCRIIVWSRNFILKYEGRKSGFVIPVTDLCNYNTEKVNVSWYYDEKTRTHKIDASKEIKKGKEIYLDYGTKSNVHYLFFYGFTLPSATKPHYYEFVFNNKKIKFNSQLELIKAMKVYRKNESEEINSYKEEIKSLIIIRSLFHNHLTSSKTTLEHDKAELAKPETKKNFNLLNIYTVLVEEKTLVTNYINHADEILDALSSDKNEIKKKLNSILKKNHSQKYLKLILAFTPKK